MASWRLSSAWSERMRACKRAISRRVSPSWPRWITLREISVASSPTSNPPTAAEPIRTRRSRRKGWLARLMGIFMPLTLRRHGFQVAHKPGVVFSGSAQRGAHRLHRHTQPGLKLTARLLEARAEAAQQQPVGFGPQGVLREHERGVEVAGHLGQL